MDPPKAAGSRAQCEDQSSISGLEDDVRNEAPTSSHTPSRTPSLDSEERSHHMSKQPRQGGNQRAFARYQDNPYPRRSSEVPDTAPLAVCADRNTTLPQGHPPSPPSPAQRPLIDLVTNKWRGQPAYHDYSSDADDTFFSGSEYQQDLDYWKSKGAAWLQHKRRSIPRPVQRVILPVSVVAIALLFVYVQWINPWLGEQAFWDKMYSGAVAASKDDSMGGYGANMEVHFDGMIHVKDLDKAYLPHGKKPGRLVFIGDVHGCKTELVRLLEKVGLDRKKDHVILTGDIVNKGPDSPGVVDVVRELDASCVRGNHEDKVLLLREELRRKELLHPSDEQLRHEARKLPASEVRARQTARELSGPQAQWLQRCPVILRVGDLPGVGPLVAVHAGLAPGVALARQDPFQVMNMRSMDPETRVPSDGRDLEKWDKVWAEWQERAGRRERTTVVYGHDSKRGLNVEGRWAKGIDSGCVNGDRLTALVLDAEGKMEVVQVKCPEGNRA